MPWPWLVASLAAFGALHLVEKQASEDTFARHFAKALKKLAVSCAITAGFFSLCVAYVDFRSPSSATLSQLVVLENQLAAWSEILQILSVPTLIACGLLVTALVVQFRLAAKLAEEVRWGVEVSQRLTAKYAARLGTLSAVVSLAATFTLFGKEVGPASESLSLRVKGLRDGYAEYRHEAIKALKDQVAAQVVADATNQAPPALTAAFDRASALNDDAAELNRRAIDAQRDYELDVLASVRSTRLGELLRRAVADVSTATPKSAGRAPAGPSAVPDEIAERLTAEKLAEAQLVLQRDQAALRARLAEKPPPWRRYVADLKSEALGALITTNNVKALEALVADRPLLGPFVKAFTGALQDRAGDLLGRQLDKHFAAALSGKEPTTSVEQLAREFVNALPPEQRLVDVLEAQRSIGELAVDEKLVREARQTANEALEVAKEKLRAANRRESKRLQAKWEQTVTSTWKARPPRSLEGLLGASQSLLDSRFGLDSVPTRRSQADYHRAMQRTLESAASREPHVEKAVLERLNSVLVEGRSLDSVTRSVQKVAAQELGAAAAIEYTALLPPEPVKPPHEALAALGLGLHGKPGSMHPHGTAPGSRFPGDSPHTRPYTPPYTPRPYTPPPRPMFRPRR
jgi:hypothetical protein